MMSGLEKLYIMTYERRMGLASSFRKTRFRGFSHVLLYVSRIVASFFLLFTTINVLAQQNKNYPPKDTTVILDKTNLPIVFLNVGGVIQKDARMIATMTIINNTNGINYGDTLLHSSQKKDYQGLVNIKYRGNSSYSNSEKKPYSIKTVKDSIGTKQKVSLLGMGKDDDWCLLAPWNDKTLIRDVLTYTLADGIFEYVPKIRLCELVFNGVYYGVYQLSARVRRGKERLNIEKPGTEGDALTGGYLMEIDRNDEPLVYVSKYHPQLSDGTIFYDENVYVQYKDPDYTEITDQQKEYINSLIDSFENILASDNFKDPNIGYSKFIDVNSFIDYQLTTEISNNIDGYRLSTYFYKHRDSIDPRFKMTIWDFNIAWGCSDFSNIHTGHMTDIWTYQNNDAGLGTKMPFWFERLMQDDEYVRKLKCRYSQYRSGNYQNVNAVVDSLVYELTIGGAADRNFKAWPSWGKYIWPNYLISNSYEEEICYLKDWIDKRINWLDNKLLIANDVQHPRYSSGFEFYSLDGRRIKEPQMGIFLQRKDGRIIKIVK